MENVESVSDSSNNNLSSCSCTSSSSSSSSSSGSNSSESTSYYANGTMFLNFPKEIIIHIFSYLNFDEIAQLRPICKTFNEVCKKMLNDGYYKMEKFHSDSLKKVKSQLPRRESERRTHRLARHGDILMAIETRLSLLSMTYGKYMDQNLCCFIPGRVIDEVRRIIVLVNTDKDPPRPHEVLQELRDISSMAMEHFDECIQPRLRIKISGGITDPLIAAANLAIVEANDTVLGFRPGFRIASGSTMAPHYTGSVYQALADQSRKVSKLENKTKDFEKRIKEKEKKIHEIGERLKETSEKLNGRIAELEKQLVEMRSMLKKDSGEVPTSRGQKFPADDLESCEFQQRPKRSRRENK